MLLINNRALSKSSREGKQFSDVQFSYRRVFWYWQSQASVDAGALAGMIAGYVLLLVLLVVFIIIVICLCR